MRGTLISLEGMDGAGKSTQLAAIKHWLDEQCIESVFSREPGGTELGEKLRDLVLHRNAHLIGSKAELLMMYAARVQHVEQLIEPALAAGKWVITDRFNDASFAYQGARGFSEKDITELDAWVLAGFEPDLTLILDVAPQVGNKRVANRGEKDHFECEPDSYKDKVRAIYLKRAALRPNRYTVIDANQTIDSVTVSVRRRLAQLLR